MKISCPQCLSAKEYMCGKKRRGFKYEKCDLCDENGEVTEELAEDFSLSLNEDLIENYE